MVNLDLWNLFMAIVSLEVRIMTLTSTVLKKNQPHLNALGRKFDLGFK